MRALEDHRDGLRRAPGLFLEQLMQKTILRIIRRCRVPLDKQLPALGVRQHINRPRGRLRRRLERVDEPFQRDPHEGRDAIGINRPLRLGRQLKSLAKVVHRQCERIVGALPDVERLDAHPVRRRPA